jgi:hypothetical protein
MAGENNKLDNMASLLPIASEASILEPTCNRQSEKPIEFVGSGHPSGAHARIDALLDQGKVISLLDRLEIMDDGSRAASDQILMLLTSACTLHERFRLAA